jgi:hypothetical protein
MSIYEHERVRRVPVPEWSKYRYIIGQSSACASSHVTVRSWDRDG